MKKGIVFLLALLQCVFLLAGCGTNAQDGAGGKDDTASIAVQELPDSSELVADAGKNAGEEYSPEGKQQSVLLPEDFGAYNPGGEGVVFYGQPSLGSISFAVPLLEGWQTSRGIKIGDGVVGLLGAYGELFCMLSYRSEGERDYTMLTRVPLAEIWEDAGRPGDFWVTLHLYVDKTNPNLMYTLENIEELPGWAAADSGDMRIEGYELYNLSFTVRDGVITDIGSYMELGG